MPHLLAQLPDEVLECITQHIPALSTFSLSHLCGDRLLASKLCRGGVKSLHFKAFDLGKLDPKLLSTFNSLTHVSIDSTRTDTYLPLDILPSSLLELDIRGQCSQWLVAPVDPKFCNNHFNLRLLPCGKGPFNFQKHFPSLHHLHLDCPCPFYSYSYRPKMALLLLRCIPSTLLTLSLSHLKEMPTVFWKHLPPGLVITEIKGVSLSTLVSILAHAPSTIRFKHMQLLDMPTLDQLLQIRSDTLELRIENLTRDNLTMLSEIQPTEPTKTVSGEPATFSAHSLPLVPRVISLRAQSWPRDARDKVNLAGLMIPPTVQSIGSRDVYPSPVDWSSLSSLPDSLKVLEFGTSVMDGAKYPKSLQELWVVPSLGKNDVNKFLSSLSCLSHLTTLRIRINSWKTASNAFLPPNLTYFGLQFDTGPGTFFLDETFFKTLPPRLTALTTLAASRDSILQTCVAPSLTALALGKLEITGAFVSASETCFNVQPVATLRRRSNGLFETAPHTHYGHNPLNENSWPWRHMSVIIEHKLIRLPPTLTRIRLDHTTPGIGAWPALNLPHLTELAVSSVLDFCVWDCHVPSLTSLRLVYGIPQSEAKKVRKLPSSITHVYVATLSNNQFFPVSLRSQLRIFELDSDYSAPKMEHFSRLETLVMHHPLVPIVLPPSLTKLSVSDSRVSATHYSMELPKLTDLTLSRSAPPHTHNILLRLPSHLQALKCPFVEIEDWNEVIPFAGYMINDDSFDLLQAVVTHFKTKFPFLIIDSSSSNYRYPSLLDTHVNKIIELWPASITRIAFPSNVRLNGQIGKLLPKTLLSLQVYTGGEAAFPWHLPKSITELSTDTAHWCLSTFRQLPPGLTSLEISAAKFFPKHAKILPSGLRRLALSASKLGRKSLSYLPEGLESLDLTQTELLFFALPKTMADIRTINSDLIDLTQLPKSLTSFTCPIGSRHSGEGSISNLNSTALETLCMQIDL